MLRSVLILIVFFVVYAAVHSLLASKPVKAWARRALGASADRWYRLAYNIFATVTILPLFVLLARLPDQMLYVVSTPWRWLMVGGQLLGLAGLAGALLQTSPLHFLGLAQLVTDQPAETESLEVSGFYCYVRHPLYSFSLIFIWLTPAMTVNLLTTYALFTLYFYLGSIHEEQRLLDEFGPAYADYQQQVPRLIPRPGRCYSPATT